MMLTFRVGHGFIELNQVESHMILYGHFLWVHTDGNLREGMEEDRGSKKKEKVRPKKRWVGLLSLYFLNSEKIFCVCRIFVID